MALLVSAAAPVALPLVAPPTAQAQTWTGNSSSNWNVASNWAGLTVPTSAASTILTFGSASNYSPNNNIAGNFLLNQLTFAASATSPYSLSGNALDLRRNGAVDPKLQNVGTANAFVSNTVLLGASNVNFEVAGSGQLNLSGPIGGTGGFTKTNTGTLVIGGSSANTFSGNVEVSGGTLGITNSGVVPSGKSLTIDTGATFRIDYLSGGNSSTPIGDLVLNGGTFRVPLSSGDYYAARVVNFTGGNLDFSGSGNFWLHLTGQGVIALTAASWTGGGSSRVQNDNTIPAEIQVSSTLTSSIPLSNGTNGQGFTINSGGTYKQTASGSTADIFVNGASYRFSDPAYLTTGALSLDNIGTLVYDGVGGATVSKTITVGPGTGKIMDLGAGLTYSGQISQSSANSPLLVDGNVYLRGTNFYTGRTEIVGGTTDVDVIANSVTPSRLGQSTAGAGNLVIDNATLRYSGTSATTDRGFTVNSLSSTVSVSSAATNLTFSGKVSGSGYLIKAGSGTLTLSNASNDWNAFNVTVNAGTLAITSPTAIPSGGIVNVNAGGSLRIDYTPGANNLAPISRLQLYGGTFRVPSGSGAYYTNHLFSQVGGVVDLSGSSGAQLVLTGAGAEITVNNSVTWLGGGLSSIRNDTASMIDFTIPTGVTLTNGILLNSGGSGQGFRITGGGTLVQTAGVSTAPITIAGFSQLQFADPMYAATAGTLTVQDFSVLTYTGATNANLPKAITLAGGGGQVGTFGPELTFPGVISESSAGQGLYVFGGTAVLTANNTYTGKTSIYPVATVSVASIPNAGVAGPLGQSAAAAGNLEVYGTLRYTGTSATTDRGLTTSAANTAIDVTSAATNLSFTGQVTGVGGLNKNGSGKLTLISSNNNYAGPTIINAGTLSIDGSGALPGGKNVTVNSGATLQLGINVNNNGNPIGSITLNDGTLRVPAGLSDYYINQLNCNGGTVDFSGSTSFWLHPVNGGASINVTADMTWTGGGSSNIRNDSNVLDINIALTKTVTSSIPLDHGTVGNGFRITGGGTYYTTSSGSDTNLTVDSGSFYRFSDPSHLTTGLITLQNFGVLDFSGAPATLNKSILLNGGGGVVLAENANLMMSGVIAEPGAGQRLDIGYNTFSGAIVTLAADNAYTGRTTLQSGTIVSVATIPNGAIASPLGKSTADAANLVLAGGTLQYTGGSAATDRGYTTSGTFAGVIEVTNPASNLTFSGQVVGTGGVAKLGAGTLTLVNPLHTSSTIVSAGTLRFQSSFTNAPTYQIFLSGSGILELASGGGSNRVIRAAGVSVSGTSKLDLRDNKLIAGPFLTAGSWTGSSYTGATGLIASGKGSSNTWNGTSGIITSMSAAVGSNYTTLGVARASDVRPATVSTTALWAGQTITGSNTLVMYTYGGDATLDGKINIDDYVKIDSGIAGHYTGWSNGDFNYDGKVSIDDYITFIDANIGNQNGFVFPTAGGVEQGVVSVPEAGTTGAMVILGLFAGIKRRRRND